MKEEIKPMSAWAVKLTYKEIKIFVRKQEAKQYAINHPYTIKGI